MARPAPAGRCLPAGPRSWRWGWRGHHGALSQWSASAGCAPPGKAPPAPLVPSSTVMGTWRSTSVSPALPCRSPLGQQEARLGVAALVLIQPLAVVTHQPLGIQDVDAIPRRLRSSPSRIIPRRSDPPPRPRQPRPRRPGSAAGPGFPLGFDGPYGARQHHGPGALDVVVERRQRLLVAGGC